MNRQTLLWLAALVAIAVLIYLVSPILTPFVIAFILAYIGNPLVSWMEKKGPSRTIAVLIGFCIIILLASLIVLLMLPIVQDQFSRLIERIPDYMQRVQAWIKSLVGSTASTSDTSAAATLGGKDQIVDIAKDALPQSGTAVAKTVDVIAQSGGMIATTLMNLLLVPVIAFYLLRDWNKFTKNLIGLVPSRFRSTTIDVSAQVDEVLRSFLKGQGLVMLCLGAMYSLGLMVIGLEFSLLIGIIAGLLSFVPYLGTAAGMLMAAVTLVMQTGNWVDLWMVAVVFGIGQFVEGNFLTPKLVGDRIDLHPVVVIFAVLAGGQLFGFVGILLALPFAAVAWVVVKRILTDFHPSSSDATK